MAGTSSMMRVGLAGGGRAMEICASHFFRWCSIGSCGEVTNQGSVL